MQKFKTHTHTSCAYVHTVLVQKKYITHKHVPQSLTNNNYDASFD